MSHPPGTMRPSTPPSDHGPLPKFHGTRGNVLLDRFDADPPWFAPEFAIQIDLGIRQHLVGSPTQRGGSDRGRGRARCRPCGQAVEAVLETAAEVRDLAGAAAPRGHTAEAAATHRVDRSTVVRIREVAKLGALAALPESRPGAGYPPVTGTQHRTSLTGHFLLLLLSSD